MPLPRSAAAFLARQRERLRELRVRPVIVFPEGDDARVAAAAAQLAAENLLEPVLIVCRLPGARCIVPAQCTRLERYARILWERSRSRGVQETEAREQA
ncbi:MAG: phosphate acyltransferase, partial [Bryobacteraceae bacterium]